MGADAVPRRGGRAAGIGRDDAWHRPVSGVRQAFGFRCQHDGGSGRWIAHGSDVARRWDGMLGGRCPLGPRAIRGRGPGPRGPGHRGPRGSRTPALSEGSIVSVLPIRRLGDPGDLVLREPGRSVEVFDDLLLRLFDDMVETMYRAPGVGLAAPQIGLSLRFFVFDAHDGEGPRGVA